MPIQSSPPPLSNMSHAIGLGVLRWHNLGQAFAAVVRKYPQRVAIQQLDGSAVTFDTLAEMAAHLAALLLDRGFGAGHVIGIMHDKTPLPYAAMLACLRIGAIYVNLDTTSPPERLSVILAQARPRLLLHSADHQKLVAELESITVVEYESADYTSASFSARLQTSRIQHASNDVPGHAPAYLMFTSGSTGQPKGVAISHQSVLNFIEWGRDYIGCGAGDVVTNINPMHFDNSVFDFYVALFNGATLVPIPDSLTKHPRRMIKQIEKIGCTIWFSVPSLLVYILRMRALNTDDMPDLRKLVFGGEGFPKPHLRELYRLIGHRTALINVYGPTECTCICSGYRVRDADLEDDSLLPIGPMAPNFTHLIVDDALHTVPSGTIGELLIGGPNLGLGYYRDPEKTAAAFIQNPTHQAYRDILYRSGDQVWWDSEQGVLRFAGRRDHQIKRMGYRIELAEIEIALQAFQGVEEAVCVSIPTAGQPLIYACVCPTMDPDSLAGALRQRLPHYMMPNEFIFQEALPRNANGKIDRVALQQTCMSQQP